jgi:hypothetical protein
MLVPVSADGSAAQAGRIHGYDRPGSSRKTGQLSQILKMVGRHTARLATIAALAGLAAVALGAEAAPALAPAPPLNDNYLQSLGLNRPRTKLNRVDTLVDRRDTRGATVQSDIFNPPSHGGPAEPTSFAGVNYGATVWYDFYPDADGLVRIRTAGFDNVVCVYPFSRRTKRPDVAHRRCRHDSSAPAEELFVTVAAGGSYTIQIGGVNGAGGNLEFKFDYIPTPPRRLSADATLTANPTSDGIRVVSLSVTATRGARVAVSCGGACRPRAVKAGTVSFPLQGLRLRAGSKIQIYVTARKSIGVLIEYDVVPGNVNKVTRCLEPGSLTPHRSCH